MDPLPDIWQLAPGDVALARGAVHVWCASLAPTRPARAAGLSLLSPAERSRMERFRGEHLQTRFAQRRLLLRRILALYLCVGPGDVSYEQPRGAKPHLAGDQAASGLTFSTSSSGASALIALSRGLEVGVDLEEHDARTFYEPVAERVLTASEYAFFRGQPEPERHRLLLDLWTKKEAYLKAIGTGLSVDPREVEVALGIEGPVRRGQGNAAHPGAPWSVRSLSLGTTCSGALCTPVGTRDVTFWRWTD